MNRAREREGSRNRHTPLHCYFFCVGKEYHKGWLVVVAKRYAMVSACPFFMCMFPSLRWDEQDSPQRCLHHLHNVYTALYDVQDIIPGRKQGEMDWRMRRLIINTQTATCENS